MTNRPESYLTDEIMAMIGVESGITEAWGTVERGALRRFTQAIMDPDPVYWDDEYASTTRFGGVVAPPLYPSFASRRPPGTPDPLDYFAEDPEWDGISGGPRLNQASGTGRPLPPVDLPLKRLLNGGLEAEFFQQAKPGDRIFAKSRYVAFSERESRGGHMVFIVTETTYTNQDDDLLLKVRSTTIRR